MKLVREYINEIFTLDSDPIHDLGIGLQYIWDNISKDDVFLILKDLPDIGKGKGAYVRIIEVFMSTSDDPGDKRIIYRYYEDKEKLLNNNDFMLYRDRPWIWNFDFMKYYMKYVGKFYKLDLNEKFTAKGDPIHDMGIGIDEIVKRLFKDATNMFGGGGYADEDYLTICYLFKYNKDEIQAKMVIEYLLKKYQYRCAFSTSEYFFAIYSHLKKIRSEEFLNDVKNMFVDYAIRHQDQKFLDNMLLETSKINDTDSIIKLVKGGANPKMRRGKPIMLAVRNRNKKVFDIMEPFIKWK